MTVCQFKIPGRSETKNRKRLFNPILVLYIIIIKCKAISTVCVKGY